MLGAGSRFWKRLFLATIINVAATHHLHALQPAGQDPVPDLQRAAGSGVAALDEWLQAQQSAEVAFAKSVAALKERIEALTSQLKAAEAQIKALRDQIDVLKEQLRKLQAADSLADVAKRRANHEQQDFLKQRIATALASIDQIQGTQIAQLKAEIQKLERQIAAAEADSDKRKKTKADAERSRAVLESVRHDKSVAQRLLSATQARNVAQLTEVLKGNGPASSVSVDAATDPAQLKLLFAIGALRQCIAVKPVCAGAQYSLAR